MRRIGASSGSQIWLTSRAAGLCVPWATQERITLMIRAKKNTLSSRAVTPMIDHTRISSGSPTPTPISIRVRAIKTNCTISASTSEARSRPPMLGMMRRNGLSSGWVARTMNWLSGL